MKNKDKKSNFIETISRLLDSFFSVFASNSSEESASEKGNQKKGVPAGAQQAPSDVLLKKISTPVEVHSVILNGELRKSSPPIEIPSPKTPVKQEAQLIVSEGAGSSSQPDIFLAGNRLQISLAPEVFCWQGVKVEQAQARSWEEEESDEMPGIKDFSGSYRPPF